VPPPIRETDLDRILKLIPAELMSFYTAAAPIIADVPWQYFAFVAFALGSALVPMVLYFDGHSTAQPARWSQYVARTLTFMAWAMAVAWPFEPWTSAHELRWVRSLAVLIVPSVGALALRERPPGRPEL
jgi:peptidoglycan/LPS O-acetylase OafA/YrhL